MTLTNSGFGSSAAGHYPCYSLAALWVMLLINSVSHQPQNSREFFAPDPRRSLAGLQPLRRSWVDFHMTTTSPSYKEYKKSIRTQIKTRRRQEPTFSTAYGFKQPVNSASIRRNSGPGTANAGRSTHHMLALKYRGHCQSERPARRTLVMIQYVAMRY